MEYTLLPMMTFTVAMKEVVQVRLNISRKRLWTANVTNSRPPSRLILFNLIVLVSFQWERNSFPQILATDAPIMNTEIGGWMIE